MKKNIYIIKEILLSLLLTILLILPAYTFAAPKDNSNAEKQRVDNLKERANREIDRRVASLSKLTSRINLIVRITSEQKTSLISEISKNITELTALKNKVTSDTDLATLKGNVKSIVDSYKIYGVFVPKIHLLITINKTDQAQIKLSDIALKLEDRIKTLKDGGKNVTSLEADLIDMKTNLANAKTKIDALQEKIFAVIPADYPGNKGILVDGKNAMASIRKDLATARQDAGKIVEVIKAMDQERSTINNTEEASKK
jgi:hypothetical protein